MEQHQASHNEAKRLSAQIERVQAELREAEADLTDLRSIVSYRMAQQTDDKQNTDGQEVRHSLGLRLACVCHEALRSGCTALCSTWMPAGRGGLGYG